MEVEPGAVGGEDAAAMGKGLWEWMWCAAQVIPLVMAEFCL